MELNVCKRKTNVVNGVQNGLEHMSGDRKTLSTTTKNFNNLCES